MDATGAGFTIALGTSTISGILSVADGGTSNSSLTANALLVGEGASPVGSLATADNTILATNASGAPGFHTVRGRVRLNINELGTITARDMERWMALRPYACCGGMYSVPLGTKSLV
jgi:hypothetical protein